jgi:hypothetical protein
MWPQKVARTWLPAIGQIQASRKVFPARGGALSLKITLRREAEKGSTALEEGSKKLRRLPAQTMRLQGRRLLSMCNSSGKLEPGNSKGGPVVGSMARIGLNHGGSSQRLPAPVLTRSPPTLTFKKWPILSDTASGGLAGKHFRRRGGGSGFEKTGCTGEPLRGSHSRAGQWNLAEEGRWADEIRRDIGLSPKGNAMAAVKSRPLG